MRNPARRIAPIPGRVRAANRGFARLMADSHLIWPEMAEPVTQKAEAPNA